MGVLIGISHSQTRVVDDDDQDFEIDFSDDFLKGTTPEEEDPAGLPTWFVKIKSILNKDIDPSRCSTSKYRSRLKNYYNSKLGSKKKFFFRGGDF